MSGIITLSMEIELGWGFHDLSHENKFGKLSENGAIERKYLTRLLDLCDTLSIPISFNVVGHLLLNNCEGFHDGPHRPNWFKNDPGTSVDSDPLFYFPDLVKIFNDTEVNHEILTHTFSHILFENVTKKTARWELNTAIDLHTDYDLEQPRTIVPPRHSKPPHDVLQDSEIHTVRLPIPEYKQPKTRLGSLFQILTRRHPVRAPEKLDGILHSYCTPHPSLTATHLPSGQASPHPVFQLMPKKKRQKIQQNYLESGFKRVAKENGFGHFWTHLHDLSNESQWEPFKASLKRLSELRDNGEINIVPMKNLNKYV